MIIARAPYRISLGGGGTDLPAFYEKEGGFVVSLAIDKYLGLIINPTVIDRRIRLEYLESELVCHASQLRHGLAREALLSHGIETAMEITSIGDLPGRAGMGSSGSYLVALLAALSAYRRLPTTQTQLAEQACNIEINRLHQPVGKQDQYMAALGNLRCLTISDQGNVSTHQISLSSTGFTYFSDNTHLYYTGLQRDASAILCFQNAVTTDKSDSQHDHVMDCLRHIRDVGYAIADSLQKENFDEFGILLDKHWQAKRSMNSAISTSLIDRLYAAAKADFGVLGGKVMGAGGGGFLMLYCPANHMRLEQYMRRFGCSRLHFGIDTQGVKMIADLRNPAQPSIDHKNTSEREPTSQAG